MGYEYDSKVNRDLAKTAMSIYTKSQGIKSLNESTINEEVLRENINGLIMNYVSDVIVLAEQELGREMTSFEINEASNELLNRINSISDNDKAAFINELAEAAGPYMGQAAGMGSGPSDQGTAVGGRNNMSVAGGKPQSRRPGVSGRRPSGNGNQLGAEPGAGPGTVGGRPSGNGNQLGAGPDAGPGTVGGRPGAGDGPSVGPGAQTPGTVGSRPGAGGEFDPSNYSSIQDYLQNGFDQFGGAGLTQVLAYFQTNPGLGQG